MDAALQELVLYRAIEEQVIRYARAVDDSHYEALADIFVPNVVVDFTKDHPEIPLIRGRDELVAVLKSVTEKCASTQHLVGNLIVSAKGKDGAESRVYLRTLHIGKGERKNVVWDVMAEYHDLWQRDDFGWRIVRRVHRSLGELGTMEALVG